MINMSGGRTAKGVLPACIRDHTMQVRQSFENVWFIKNLKTLNSKLLNIAERSENERVH